MASKLKDKPPPQWMMDMWVKIDLIASLCNTDKDVALYRARYNQMYRLGEERVELPSGRVLIIDGCNNMKELL